MVSIVGCIEENLEEFPLGEAELARDQWWAPNDSKRIEFKRGKLARLGIAATPVMAPTTDRNAFTFVT